MPNLSKTTIRKMNRVIDAVMANAKFYDQGTFPEETDCGATCCAAGFAVWINVTRKKYAELVKSYSGSLRWSDLAQEYLGLDFEDFNEYDLFFGAEEWPDKYRQKYDDATTPIGRAKALKAYWKHYIAKDGVVDGPIPF